MPNHTGPQYKINGHLDTVTMCCKLLDSCYYLLLCAVVSSAALAQDFDERFSDWPVETSIRGRVIVTFSAGSDGKDAVADLLTSSEKQSSVILFHSANETARQFADLFSADAVTSLPDQCLVTANDLASVAPALAKTKLLCWTRNEPLTRSEREHVVRQSPILHRFVRSGGTIVLAGSAATVAGAAYRDSDSSASVTSIAIPGSAFKAVLPGCNLIPDTVLSDSSQDISIFAESLTGKPRHVGLQFERPIAAVLDGRKLRMAGRGQLQAALPSSGHLPKRLHTIKPQTGDQTDPNAWLIDLTEWRRDAIDRTLPQFPPSTPETPVVENGTLMIVGGGGLPIGLMDSFVQHAGGVEDARLIYVPCSETENIGQRHGILQLWKRMGVKSAAVVHTKDRNRANSDTEFLQPLREATGIWFGGGRQWNFADSYFGTEAHRLMKAVLSRGGVIGGSSAGASIQASYLARATPIGNTRIMAPGYERGGLGFIRGVAIDQHFTQRKRQADMTELMSRHPQLLGIGIDEATALIVKKSVAEITGQGLVFFYDRRKHSPDDMPDFLSLSSGAVYDLAARKVLQTGARSANDEE